MKPDILIKSLKPNEKGIIRIECDKLYNYEQLQIEIVETGKKNCENVMGFANKPTHIAKDIYEIYLDTKSLVEGIYEIQCIIYHTPLKKKFLPKKIKFIGQKDFDRLFFEITSSDHKNSNIDLMNTVLKKEKNSRLFKCIDLRQNKNSSQNQYLVHVFIKGLLIGKSIAFESFQIAPSSMGVDNKDSLEFTNQYLIANKFISVPFKYEETEKETSRRENPVAIMNYPCIFADSENDIISYCYQEANKLLDCYSLIRDTKGRIFDLVIVDSYSRIFKRFTYPENYKGNRITGSLAGEVSERIETVLKAIETKPFNRFLVQLYKEAMDEEIEDFVYLRFWQILEVISESKNYTSTDELRNLEGDRIQDCYKLEFEKLNKSKNNVYKLILESNLGSNSTWLDVNIWYAFRCAVAHSGSIANWTKLSDPSVLSSAKKGIKKIESKGGINMDIMHLKNLVRFIILKQLTPTTKQLKNRSKPL